MKHLKKLGGVLLALVMVMALAAPAFATSTGGENADKTFKITVTTTGVDGATSPARPTARISCSM